MLTYRVIIEKDEDGVLIAKVPDLPGCATEGKTREELMKNVKEAIQAYLEGLKEHGDPVPIETVLQEKRGHGGYSCAQTARERNAAHHYWGS